MPFTNLIRHKMGKEERVCIKSFVVGFLVLPDLGAGDAAVQLDELNSTGLIGP